MSATKQGQVDEELRRATISVLGESGFAGLTLERVAEVAGRARSTLWRRGLTREVLVEALVGELAEDFRATMYPILMSHGTGRERLERGLGALCDLLDRHLALMLATDEAFHQPSAPDEPPAYLHPFIVFLREARADGSLDSGGDDVLAADLAFNGVAWPYVHLRGRHNWDATRARELVVSVVLNGLGGLPNETSQKRKEPT
jgi:AcrR family transcriptional regulator